MVVVVALRLRQCTAAWCLSRCPHRHDAYLASSVLQWYLHFMAHRKLEEHRKLVCTSASYRRWYIAVFLTSGPETGQWSSSTEFSAACYDNVHSTYSLHCMATNQHRCHLRSCKWLFGSWLRSNAVVRDDADANGPTCYGVDHHGSGQRCWYRGRA